MSGNEKRVNVNKLMYKSVNDLNKVAEKIEVVIKTTTQCTQYCKSVNEIFKKAETCYKNGDDEEAYMLYMRCYIIYKKIRESYEFNKEKNTFLSLLKNCNIKVAIEKAEELSDQLQKRYTELAECQDKSQKKNQNGLSSNEDQFDLILPDVPTDFKIRSPENTHITKETDKTSTNNHNEINNPSSSINLVKKTCTFISVNKLYEILKDCKSDPQSTLLIDVRPVEEYNEASICHQCMINVPENILKTGANVNTIEMKLSKETWELWKSRFEKKNVVIIDYNLNEDLFTPTCPVKILSDVLLKFEGGFQLFAVLGGFKEWHLSYPALTTNPTYCKLPQNMTFNQDLLSLVKDLLYPELIFDKKKDETKIVDTSSVANFMRPDEMHDKNNTEKENYIEIPVENQTRSKNVTDNSNSQISLSEIVPNSQKSEESKTHFDKKHSSLESSSLNLVSDKNLINNRDIKENVGKTIVDIKENIIKTIVDIKENEDNPISNNNMNGDNTIRNNNGNRDNTIRDKSSVERISDNDPINSYINKKDNFVSSMPTNLDKLLLTQPVVGLTTSDKLPVNVTSHISPPILPVSSNTSTQHLTNIQNLTLPDKPKVSLQPKFKANSENLAEQGNSVPNVSLIATSHPVITVPSMIRQINPNIGLLSPQVNAIPNVMVQSSLDLPKQGENNNSSSVPAAFVPKQFSTNSLPVQKPKCLATLGLPNGWEKAISHDTGRVYYKDHNTETTHWELPIEVQQQMLTKPVPRKESSVTKAFNDSFPVPNKVSHNDAESKMKRSLSSPNLNDASSDQLPKLKSLPVIDRLSKPTEKKTVLVDRTTKPVSASRLEKLAPIYGSMGRVLTGLKNLGNTCYMNSVIQCLACTLPLGKYFTTGMYEKHLNLCNTNAHPGELARELAFLIIVISAGEYRSVSPIDFKIALGKFAPDFSGFKQQDAHELLMFFMDGLHEDVNKIVKKEIIKVKETDNLSDEIAADIAWKDYKLNNDSVIVDLFQGQFRSTVTCLSCNKRSKTFDAFNCLQLPLPSNQSTTLENCIQTFTKAEKIGGNDSWKCSNCKRYREASKTIEIWKLPPVLIIQLKRFHFDGRWHNKIQTTVNFPMQNFNMSKYIVAPQSIHTKYHLYAVINHYGSFESGHYTANCVNPYYEKWYNFDDSIVKEIDVNSIKTNTAYLLFYTAVDFKEYIKR
ncbi:ubiquitin carboxyl-terminal hydrolase 8 isoform X1 [Hydra vulgaris]|uniref:ubiquitin carboxyl-terminal hydrolase 8 isoform X1 n=1 Tax=Hydra vulgaris TaxID=6087 RepID=UPI001F5F694C|nr:ubiquitin carboxyl-terminal hydrolase 8 isoform X1 [Hydra vulgaris]